MATTKKATTKKAPTTKARAAKTTRPAAAKPKTTTVRTVKKPVQKQSARQSSFMSLTPTTETAYWLVLGGLVIVLAVWIASLTIRVQNLYDRIEVQSAANNSIVVPRQHHEAGQ